MKKPIVWTIAGSDSGGGAGIQTDIKTFQALGTYGCSVITAITAQNSYEVLNIDFCSADTVKTQITALEKDLFPKAVKLGMLGSIESLKSIASFLSRYEGFVVCDPVMVSTSGALLLAPNVKDYFIKEIIPHADLLTPNLLEVESLLNCSIQNAHDIEKAARKLLDLGSQSILIKGGHGASDYCQDFWTNGQQSFWLTIKRRSHTNNHGSGCTLSAAIAACMALGYCLSDALVIAKSYVSQGIRMAHQYGQGPGPIAHYHWPMFQEDLPWITPSAEEGINRPIFFSCHPEELGVYPIVDSVQCLKKLLPVGVKTFQLRIKNKEGNALEKEIKESIAIAKQHQARLFINDYWELAIAHNAYGIHLGQEDLIQADSHAIAKAAIRLGISTHCYYEVARAHALRPSYIACGPIYATNTKKMPFAPQGIAHLKRWRELLKYPLVAIGGISIDRLNEVLACKVEGVAVISAILSHPKPEQAAAEFLEAYRSASLESRNIL